LPFEVGEPKQFAGLTLIPLFPAAKPQLDYLGLDEASARGLTVSEIGAEGVVELLALENPLDECVLLYEGEELVGAKQNRILDQTILGGAKAGLKIPAKCVERGRWSHHTQHFVPAPRAAYPALRMQQRLGQGAVWADVAAKQVRLGALSASRERKLVSTKRSPPQGGLRFRGVKVPADVSSERRRAPSRCLPRP
jgi:hypothetical protein